MMKEIFLAYCKALKETNINDKDSWLFYQGLKGSMNHVARTDTATLILR